MTRPRYVIGVDYGKLGADGFGIFRVQMDDRLIATVGLSPADLQGGSPNRAASAAASATSEQARRSWLERQRHQTDGLLAGCSRMILRRIFERTLQWRRRRFVRRRRRTRIARRGW